MSDKSAGVGCGERQAAASHLERANSSRSEKQGVSNNTHERNFFKSFISDAMNAGLLIELNHGRLDSILSHAATVRCRGLWL